MIDLAPLRARVEGVSKDKPLGVAVSGGGDSVALLRMLAVDLGLPVSVATVDHGLRSDAADEAAFVVGVCADLNVPHTTLTIALEPGANVQARARAARYAALADWAKGAGMSHVALGHTKDDQAETFLLRLARGSGVDGLAGMAPQVHRGGITWVRPLLSYGRDELRQYLTDHNQKWVDDPSNDDPTYDRIRMRQAAPLLADLGLGVDRLADTAARMADARAALTWGVGCAFTDCVTVILGCASVDRTRLATFPMEIQTRLLGQMIQGIAGGDYAPRFDGVKTLLADPKGGTLAGVQTVRDGDTLWMFREPAQIADLTCKGDGAWDDRWVFTDHAPDLHIAPLGQAGQAALKVTLPKLPFAARVGLPGLWRGDALIAGPQGAALIRPVWQTQVIH